MWFFEVQEFLFLVSTSPKLPHLILLFVFLYSLISCYNLLQNVFVVTQICLKGRYKSVQHDILYPLTFVSSKETLIWFPPLLIHGGFLSEQLLNIYRKRQNASFWQLRIYPWHFTSLRHSLLFKSTHNRTCRYVQYINNSCDILHKYYRFFFSSSTSSMVSVVTDKSALSLEDSVMTDGLTLRSLHWDCSQSLIKPWGSLAKLNMNSLWVFSWLMVSMVSWIWEELNRREKGHQFNVINGVLIKCD